MVAVGVAGAVRTGPASGRTTSATCRPNGMIVHSHLFYLYNGFYVDKILFFSVLITTSIS